MPVIVNKAAESTIIQTQSAQRHLKKTFILSGGLGKTLKKRCHLADPER